jgi:hypothetical protein
MAQKYTFENLWYDLDRGYQIQYTYLNNRYQLTKLNKNCYSQKLLSKKEKNSQPQLLMITLKRVKEIFDFMEDIEYKIIDNTQ